jgi:peroxiredoxin Q/BCP
VAWREIHAGQRNFLSFSKVAATANTSAPTKAVWLWKLPPLRPRERPCGIGDIVEGMSESKLSIGDAAPDFTAPTDDGTFTLSAHLGKNVILYFYPAAMTPGCTTEACDFRDSLSSLAAAGYEVVGISKDTPEKLAEFRAAEGLSFPLVSDPDKSVHDAYGAWGEKKLYGKVVTGSLRSTFVVDKDGRIALAQYNVKATGHVAKLRRDLGLDS